ncbi:MAG: alpha/beta hydrolase [Nocardioidaceae bacterium]|nr:alpha/beta hydrolase [Nocardioidaceae bacterium]
MSAPSLEVLGPRIDPRVDPRVGPGGDRPPLLFVPGLGHEATCWDRWRTAATEAGYPAYAMSLRGHGTSEGNVRRARIGQYRDDVIRTALSLPDQPVLVGHSMGGLVAAMAAARMRVRALVLVAAVPARPAVGSLLTVVRQHPLDAAGILAGRTLRMRPEYLYERLDDATAADYISRCGPESPIAQYQLIFHRRPGRPLGGAPVLSLAARADRLVPLADVRATARHYDAELIELDDLGHNLMQDEGWELPWAAAEAWLNRILGSTVTV